MKTYQFTDSTKTVNCYQKADLEKIAAFVKYAEDLWYSEWVRQGSKDEGTCCGGKGIEVWYFAPRKRRPDTINIVRCTWVQGNISAQRSMLPALAYLKECGIECTYNDGWMD
jgi:hypothetical protein